MFDTAERDRLIVLDREKMMVDGPRAELLRGQPVRRFLAGGERGSSA